MYRIVDTRFWSDEKVRALRPTAKLVFVYLVTGPQSNLTGVYRYNPAAFADDLGMSRRSYLHCQNFLQEAGIVEIFADDRLIWVKKMFKYQGTASPKVLKYVRAYLDTLPPGPVLASFYMAYPYVLERPIIAPKAMTVSDTVSGCPQGTVWDTVSVQYQYQKYKDLSTTRNGLQQLEPTPADVQNLPPTGGGSPTPSASSKIVRFPHRDRPGWDEVESVGQIFARIAATPMDGDET